VSATDTVDLGTVLLWGAIPYILNNIVFFMILFLMKKYYILLLLLYNMMLLFLFKLDTNLVGAPLIKMDVSL
jgi:hypothetical protein